MISSSQNAQIKHLIKLQEKNTVRKAEGMFVCEGRKMFQEVLKYAKDSLVKTYFAESSFKQIQETGIPLQDFDYEIVTDAVFCEAAQAITPQGVLAIVKQPFYSLENMLLGKESAKLIALENIQDPGNLGTILRTAEAAGMDGVILSAKSVDMFNPKVIRSTMGAIYRMPFFYAADFEELLIRLKQEAFSLYAAHLDGAVSYDAIQYAKKTVLLIGNEANGLTQQTTSLADCRIRIPMQGSTESLNAAVAAAVLMYEVYRQERS